MVKKSPQEAASKWKKNIKASTSEIAAGVGRVTEAPGIKAAAAQEKMMINLMESLESGRWAASVSGVSLEDWKKAMIEKGIPRIAKGAEEATAKVVAFQEWLLPKVQAAQDKIKAMPSITLDDNIDRMNTYTREMAKSKYKK